jgi:anti-anti-sigma regulatory factor
VSTEHGHCAGDPAPAVRLCVCEPIDAETMAELCGTVTALLDAGEKRVVICDAGGPVAPTLALVDGLARLQLAAIRSGGEIRVCAMRPDLRALLALTGLGDIITACGEHG